MTGNTAWHKWSSKLAISLDREFERACLPFLRLLWPQLIIPKPLAKWDRQGIDLISFGDGPAIECVVQCKSSQQKTLGKGEILDAEKSIGVFQKSGHRCDTYLLVINGDGRSTDYNASVGRRLKDLVASGAARRAELWPRTTLMKNSFDRIPPCQ